MRRPLFFALLLRPASRRYLLHVHSKQRFGKGLAVVDYSRPILFGRCLPVGGHLYAHYYYCVFFSLSFFLAFKAVYPAVLLPSRARKLSALSRARSLFHAPSRFARRDVKIGEGRERGIIYGWVRLGGSW